MSQGRQGRLPGKPVHIDHRAEAKPFHGRAFSVPKACEKIALPRTVKQVRSSHLVTPLTELTKKTSKSFKWQTKHQEAFNNLQHELTRQVILAYPDFTKMFEIYTDASKYQIGAVITQENKPIAFYSRKLTDCQARYSDRLPGPVHRYQARTSRARRDASRVQIHPFGPEDCCLH